MKKNPQVAPPYLGTDPRDNMHESIQEFFEGSMADLGALCRKYHVDTAPIVVAAHGINTRDDASDTRDDASDTRDDGSDTPKPGTTTKSDLAKKLPSKELAKRAGQSNQRKSRSTNTKDGLKYLGFSLLRRGVVPFLGLDPFDCLCMCASWYARDLRAAVLSPECINAWRSWVADKLKPIFPNASRVRYCWGEGSGGLRV